MREETTIEIATYIVVASAIWIVSPILGKYIVSFFFESPSLFSNSLVALLTGLFLVLLGTILAVWTIVMFKTEGRGTPNPIVPPQALIRSGPNRYSRNPMALGGLLVLLGEALVYASRSLLGIGLLFGAVLYFNTKCVEEPELRNRFGAEYEDYVESVDRFFPNPMKVKR